MRNIVFAVFLSASLLALIIPWQLFAGSPCSGSCCRTAERQDPPPYLPLTLRINAHTPWMEMGSSRAFDLELTGTDLGEILKTDDWKGHDYRPDSSGIFISIPRRYYEFEMEFRFTPEKTGWHEIGPFELEFQGERLKSNSWRIKVLEPWGEKETGFRFDLLDDRLKAGEETLLVIRQRYAEKESLIKVITTSGENKEITADGYGGGSGLWHNWRYEFTIKPSRPGIFTITREDFTGLPDNVDFPEIKITVAE